MCEKCAKYLKDGSNKTVTDFLHSAPCTWRHGASHHNTWRQFEFSHILLISITENVNYPKRDTLNLKKKPITTLDCPVYPNVYPNVLIHP